MKMEHVIKIKAIEKLTHNVKKFQCEKPDGYYFIPGQATEISINKEGWKEEKKPFTFTSLNDFPDLEFTIKIYSDHPGVTNELNTLVPGDELIVRDVWGAIEYKGPGYFICGGAGITPFIAILRQLKRENNLNGNKLLFSNRTNGDIILEEELSPMLGKNAFYIITDERSKKYYNGFINEQFIKEHIEDFSKHFYLCGPPKMVEGIQDCLTRLGASPEALVFER
jgi:ferredoxin-NADP reductase